MTRRIAIALFGEEVSPRFCFAEAVTIVDIADGCAVARQIVSLGEPWLAGRLSRLAELGVDTLVCGGFNRAYLPAAKRLGIDVITGVAGKHEQALARFVCGATGCLRGAKLGDALVPRPRARAAGGCRRRKGS